MNAEQKDALIFVLKQIEWTAPDLATREEASRHVFNISEPLPLSNPKRGTDGFGSTDRAATPGRRKTNDHPSRAHAKAATPKPTPT